MAKDFNASQVRTEQIIGENAQSGKPSIIVVNYNSPGVDYEGSGVSSPVLMNNVGDDVFLFVSGSSNSAKSSVKGATLFGGDVVVSGNIIDSQGTLVSGIGGSSMQVQFNDSGTFGGDAGFLYEKNTQTLFVNNLVITGTITSVTSSNLVISDPVLFIASGSTNINQNGGLAISSGSSTAGLSLVIGRVANDTWGVGKIDANGGEITDLTSMSLVPFRSSKFEVGNQDCYLTSSGTDLTINSNRTSVTGVLELSDELVIENNLLRIRSQSLGSRSSYIEAAGINDHVAVRINNVNVLDVGKFSVTIPVFTPLYLGSTTYFSSSLLDGSEISSPSLKIVGANGSNFYPSNTSDTFLFVSGAIGSKDTLEKGTTVFGGDVVISGVLHGGSPLKVGGSMGLSGSLRIATTNIAPDVGANESVVYVLDSLGVKKLYWKNSDGVQQQVGTGGGGSSSGTFNEVPVLIPGGSPTSFVTTSSVSIAGEKGSGWSVENTGNDVFFYVSGSIGTSNTFTRGTSVFGGDVHVSGSFSQGFQNKTIGSYTFAAGALSEAIGIGSFVQGIFLTTSGTYQAVFGKYNDHTFAESSGFSIGNGSPGGRSDLLRAYNQIVEVTGTLSANYLSGSLTKLTDGSSYLVAGSNILIESGSNGQITISASGGPSSSTPSYFVSDVNGSIYTTGTVAFKGNEVLMDPHQKGDDVIFYVSGTANLRNNPQRSIALFGGDLTSSGTITSLSGISGTINVVGSYQSYANLSSKPTTLNTIDTSVYAVTGSLFMSSSNSTEQRFLGSHCGGIYNYSNSNPQVLTPGVFEIIDWAASGGTPMSGSGNIIPDVAQNGLILNKVGMFLVNISLTFSGTAGALYGVNAMLGSTPQQQVALELKLHSSHNTGNAGCTGIVYNPAIGTLLSAWIIGNTSTVTIRTAQITANAV